MLFATAKSLKVMQTEFVVSFTRQNQRVKYFIKLVNQVQRSNQMSKAIPVLSTHAHWPISSSQKITSVPCKLNLGMNIS